MYQIHLNPTAIDDLSRLPSLIEKRVLKKLHTLAEEPRKGSKKLVDWEQQWRSRVGDYRILYEINDSTSTITVYHVKHRKEVYRK